MVWVVLALVGVGFAASFPLTALARAAGRRAGALDSPGAPGHRKALRPVPNTGGHAIYFAVAAPIIVGLAAVWWLPMGFWEVWVPAMVPHLPRTGESSPLALGLVAALTGVHVVGWIDDRRSLSPWIKLIVEIAAASFVVAFFEVRLLELLGTVPSVVLTVVWIVAVTNAVNFMDNMDGLAAGTTAIAAALFMVACIVNSQWLIAATLALLIGALGGFLVFNFPPATIFMGDRGSLVVGFLLAILTVRTTYYQNDPQQSGTPLGEGWYALFMPLIVLAIPLYDLVSVTFIRLKQGRSPFVGDQQHFSHRLVQRGMSTRGAVIVIWAATAVTGIGGISLGRLQAWQAILVGVQTALVLVMLALLEHASRRPPDREPAS